MKNQLMHILINHKIPVSWFTLSVGRKLGLTNNIDIIEFAVNQFENSSPLIKSIVLNLATYYGQKTENENSVEIEKKLCELIDCLKRNNCIFNEAIEIDKFLYAALMNLAEHEKNMHVLLEKVEEIYADFNYPSSMNSFIGYMPPHNYDPSYLAQEECLQKIYENIWSHIF